MTARPPSGLRAKKARLDGDEVVVFSWPIASEAPATALTESEREVGRLLLAGLTDAEIARVRGTTPRTVGKQVVSLYRKLGVASRRELWARAGRRAR